MRFLIPALNESRISLSASIQRISDKDVSDGGCGPLQIENRDFSSNSSLCNKYQYGSLHRLTVLSTVFAVSKPVVAVVVVRIVSRMWLRS